MKNIKQITKRTLQISAALGSTILLGVIGGTLVKSITNKKVLAYLMIFGWSSMTGSLPIKAAEQAGKDVDGIFEMIDDFKNKTNESISE